MPVTSQFNFPVGAYYSSQSVFFTSSFISSTIFSSSIYTTSVSINTGISFYFSSGSVTSLGFSISCCI
jgi:hypothetical protein